MFYSYSKLDQRFANGTFSWETFFRFFACMEPIILVKGQTKLLELCKPVKKCKTFIQYQQYTIQYKQYELAINKELTTDQLGIN